MAFTIRNLSVLAYAQGFTLWHYKSGSGTHAEAAREGFFDDAEDMLAVGDMVMVSGSDGGKLLFVAAMPGAMTQGGVMTTPLG